MFEKVPLVSIQPSNIDVEKLEKMMGPLYLIHDGNGRYLDGLWTLEEANSLVAFLNEHQMFLEDFLNPISSWNKGRKQVLGILPADVMAGLEVFKIQRQHDNPADDLTPYF